MGDKKGVSAKLTLAAGTYALVYHSTAPDGGCYFSLLLESKAGGKILKSTWARPDNSGPFAGIETWTIKAGTYVLQEDRTGLTNCKGAWTATLTPA